MLCENDTKSKPQYPQIVLSENTKKKKKKDRVEKNNSDGLIFILLRACETVLCWAQRVQQGPRSATHGRK